VVPVIELVLGDNPLTRNEKIKTGLPMNVEKEFFAN
jgi:hypothetical protein